MRTAKANPNTDRRSALRELKLAVVEGATWRYERLVAQAFAAGATDEEIDATAHEALEALLLGAEKPLTALQLAHEHNGGQSRR
jgi:hypothetical protein